jgi:hypothetical protein
LITCLATSRLLKAASSMQVVLLNMVRFLYGKEDAAEIARMLHDKEILLPSDATLSRARLRLDVVMMLERRRSIEHAPDFFSYLSGDASPQGGREYLCVLEDIVSREEASRVFQPGYVVSLETRALPPTVLGSGRCGLDRKFGSLVHALQLDVSSKPECLSKYSQSVLAWLSDFGTEASMPEVPPVPIKVLQRDFVRQTEGLLRYQKFLADVPHSADHLSIGDANNESNKDESEDAAESAEAPCFSLASTLLIPGMKHVCDNIQSEVSKAMTWNSEFQAGVSRGKSK